MAVWRSYSKQVIKLQISYDIYAQDQLWIFNDRLRVTVKIRNFIAVSMVICRVFLVSVLELQWPSEGYAQNKFKTFKSLLNIIVEPKLERYNTK